MAGSKHSCILSIHSLLFVYPFSLRDIWSSRPIFLVYQLSFHFLPLKITNKNSRRHIVLIASIKDVHFRILACFIKTCFWCFENTTLKLLSTPNIYLFSCIFWVFCQEFYILFLLTGINWITAVLFQDLWLNNAPDPVISYILIIKLSDNLKIRNSS